MYIHYETKLFCRVAGYTHWVFTATSDLFIGKNTIAFFYHVYYFPKLNLHVLIYFEKISHTVLILIVNVLIWFIPKLSICT